MFNLFVGFDQQALDEKSHDLTTFQTPLSALHLTLIPMGYMNSAQIFHSNITFILQDAIPHITMPYIDDIPVKGPQMSCQMENTKPSLKTQRSDSLYGNISRMCIMSSIGYRKLVSGKKMDLCLPEVIIVGHKCTYEGHLPDETCIQKVKDWPLCKDLTDVQGFLGTAGTVWTFIQNFAIHAHPLIQLTKEDQEFVFGETEQKAMHTLKYLMVNSPTIHAINYSSDCEVILTVDLSWCAVGFILLQMGADNKCYPSHFGSITWNDREQCYSQAKIELYGLFHALHNV